MELVRHDIRINSLTSRATDSIESFDRAERWGREVARPQGFSNGMEPFRTRVLVTDKAAMITWTELRVDAGASARYWA
jgi:hypothetical protein